MRGNSAIVQDEYDEHESVPYQEGTEPFHLLIFPLGRMVGFNGEGTINGDQSCDSCRNLENESPSFAVQDVLPSVIFHHLTEPTIAHHSADSTTMYGTYCSSKYRY